jgi:hypothetical protein
MQTIQPSPFLQRVLLADAVVSGAVAIVQVAFAEWLAGLLRLPSPLLTGTGFFLVGYVVLLAVLARTRRLWAGLIWLVVVGNAAWAVGCVGLAMFFTTQPSAFGMAFLTVQAITVLIFAALEFHGLTNSHRSTGPALA